ncbi:MAG: DMT family transporter [Bacteroidetes bacterium]|nr:DMT family transporter [Bacteroidota bacterium]
MWLLFASLNPVSEGFRSVVVKKTSAKTEPIIISWGNYFLPVLLFTPGLFFIELDLNPTALIASFISSSINTLAAVWYIKAISEGDISEVLPMMSFTPLVLLITSPIIVGEFPPFLGFVGVLLIVVGSYLININFKKRDFLGPFKALIRNRGTRHMLFVAAIWGISANFDKIAITESSIPQHVIFMNIFIFTSLTIYLLLIRKLKWQKIKPVKSNLLAISAFTCCAFIFHMTALSMTYVAYVVALKRMSGPIAVVLGHFFLKEPNIKARLIGSLVMVAGVALIVLA